MSSLTFQIKYKAQIPNGPLIEGIEEEGSWFLVDQIGKVWSCGPMKSPRLIGPEYLEAIPLIKIGEEYLSIDEITKRLAEVRS